MINRKFKKCLITGITGSGGSYLAEHIISKNISTKVYGIYRSKGNKKLTFYRIEESPELLLFRKDEGLLYHFPSDLGFTMLNPHVQQKEEK